MQASKEQIVMMVATLAEVFNRQMSPAALEAYAMSLNGFTREELEVAFGRAVDECQFMPVPAELRALAGIRSKSESPESMAIVAFAAVSNAVQSIGPYRSVTFDDPVVNATIRTLGGWPQICDKPESEFDTFFRNDFIKQYSAFRRIGVMGELTGALAGLHDQQNGLNGYKVAPPRVVPCGTTGDVKLIEPIAIHPRIARIG